ncbi:hypothetical protein ACTFIV_009940 [Dictyostelium citrinum]
MEVFNEQYQNQRDSDSVWVETLKKFNTENADKRVFTDKVSVNTKEQLTYNLFHYLKNEFNPSQTVKPSVETMVQVLTSLRISLREFTEKDRDIVKNELNIFFKLGNIGEAEKIKIYDNSIREEALKCIVNCISRDPVIQNTFLVEMNGPITLTREVKKNSGEMSEGLLDVIYKVLVHCCAKPEIKLALRPEGLLEFVSEQLLTKVTTTDAITKSAPLLSDLCRLLFTLTIHLGPLEGGRPTPPNHLELEGCRRLLPIFKKIITQYTPGNNASDPIYNLKCAVISALINTPKDLYDELIEEIPLTYFQEIFKSQIHLLSSPETAAEFLPILMLLTNTAENVVSTRQQLKEMTFPYDLIKETDEPLSVGIEPPEEVKKTGISSKLIPFMTGSDIGLKHFVSEYFFMICDEDANEVCRLTGFGNAAGLLVTRGLMSLGGK